jgi:hypothetical protein
MSSALGFDQLADLTGDRLGVFDGPCPLCAPLHNNRRKKVLRVWADRPGFFGFACARCGERGWVCDRNVTARPSPERLAEIRVEAEARTDADVVDNSAKAKWLWGRRQSVQGTAAETYLREARGYRGPIQASLGFLPPSKGYPPALIAAFGLATEPEPGRLAFNDADLRGLHLIKLTRDGRDRLRSNDAKISVGRGSLGSPIVLAAANDLLGLAITEGLEDALSVHQATGLGCWAAGSAGRMPALADAVPSYVEVVTIAAHYDLAGRRAALALADALCARGIETILLGVAP